MPPKVIADRQLGLLTEDHLKVFQPRAIVAQAAIADRRTGFAALNHSSLDVVRRPETDALYPLLQPAGAAVRNIIYLLRQGKQVEIIVGDKTPTTSIFLKTSRSKSSARCPTCMRSTCAAS
ncbi:hypothetical protein ABMB44_12945 [Levilactobacillus brevis]